jgi:hypothetical protein
MNKRERVMRAVNFQETDRIPIYDFIDNNRIREYFSGEKITKENAWRLEYAAVRAVCDATRALLIPTFHPHRMIDEDGFVTYHDYETSWIEKRPFEDVTGLKRWAMKDMERAKKWKPDLAYVEEYRSTILAHKRGIGDDTVIIVESDVGLENPRDKAGLELFSYLVADEPAMVSAWIEALNEKEIRKAKAIADPELVPIMLTYGDIAFKTGLIHSPGWLRREFIPRLKKLVDAYHERGVKCLYHSDGNLNEILDDLVGAGIDGINPVETAAGMDIADIRSRYPNIFIAGGIDVSQLLTLANPEEVRATCLKAIEDTGGVGYLMGSTTELLPMAKIDNVLAMIECAHSFNKMSA